MQTRWHRRAHSGKRHATSRRRTHVDYVCHSRWGPNLIVDSELRDHEDRRVLRIRQDRTLTSLFWNPRFTVLGAFGGTLFKVSHARDWETLSQIDYHWFEADNSWRARLFRKDSAPTYVIELCTGEVVTGNFGWVYAWGAKLSRAGQVVGSVTGADSTSLDWRITSHEGPFAVELLAALAFIHGEVAYG